MIGIFAGHSDQDPGAVANGATEAAYAVVLRDLISERLTAMGVAHCTDGAAGKNMPLTEAVRLAKLCDIAVEIHCNAAASSSATGVECISHPNKKPLSQRLSACVASTLRLKLRGEGGWIDQSKSQHSRLAMVVAGGLILEVGFLTNPLDLAAMQTYKNLLARNIAEVLAREFAK